MSARHRLQKLLHTADIGGRVWLAGGDRDCDRDRRGRGDRAAWCSRQWILPTGFDVFDRALAGGWPLGALIELFVESSGVGELQLLMPALTRLAGVQMQATATAAHQVGVKDRKWILLIAPPYLPYAPAFARHGLNLSRVLVVHCRRQAEVLWSIEQALQSGTCAAVLAWSGSIDERALRRLQLAAEATRNAADGCWLVLFRAPRFRQQRSPAALRVHLQAGTSSALKLHIFKQRGGRPRHIVLDPGVGFIRAGVG